MPSLEQWQAMWHGLGVETSDETLYHALSGRYTEPHRHYRTLQHLDECFAWMPPVTSLAVHPHEIELALWFHDRFSKRSSCVRASSTPITSLNGWSMPRVRISLGPLPNLGDSVCNQADGDGRRSPAPSGHGLR